MCKISENDLTKEGFVKDNDRRIFNICPNPMYRWDYIINGDKCPVFITKFGTEYCHVVPADNSIKCAFVPIKSVTQLRQLMSALEGEELSNEKESK